MRRPLHLSGKPLMSLHALSGRETSMAEFGRHAYCNHIRARGGLRARFHFRLHFRAHPLFHVSIFLSWVAGAIGQIIRDPRRALSLRDRRRGSWRVPLPDTTPLTNVASPALVSSFQTAFSASSAVQPRGSRLRAMGLPSAESWKLSAVQ